MSQWGPRRERRQTTCVECRVEVVVVVGIASRSREHRIAVAVGRGVVWRCHAISIRRRETRVVARSGPREAAGAATRHVAPPVPSRNEKKRASHPPAIGQQQQAEVVDATHVRTTSRVAQVEEECMW